MKEIINIRKLFNALTFSGGDKPQQPEEAQEKKERVRFLDSSETLFSRYSSHIEDDITVRTYIDVIARHASKLKPIHVLNEGNSNITPQSDLSYLLAHRPNEYQCTAVFLEKLICELFLYGNAFVYIKRNKRNKIVGLYVLDYNTLDIKEKDGFIFCSFFIFGGNQEIIVPYDELIHIRRHFYNREFYGLPAERSIKESLELLDISKQAIKKKIQNSGRLRGILQIRGNSKVPDWVDTATQFTQNFLSHESNTGGIAAIDDSTTFTPINNKIETVDDGQLDYIQQCLGHFFAVSKPILNGDYTPEQWQAFYESLLEPLAVQLSQEFTHKIFTRAQQEAGHEIVFNTNRLSYASASAKINMIKEMGAMGLISINEARALFDLPPVEDGQKRLQSLNYIDVAQANAYQTADGKTTVKGGEKTDEKGNKKLTN